MVALPYELEHGDPMMRQMITPKWPNQTKTNTQEKRKRKKKKKEIKIRFKLEQKL